MVSVSNSLRNIVKEVVSRRQWELVIPSHKLKKPHEKLRVMSYNVLSDHLLKENLRLYQQCSPSHLDFKYRSQKIIQDIVNTDSTIVCLQEVDAKYWDSAYKGPLEQAGYTGHFIKRTGDDKYDGVAILYKKAMFKLVKCEEVEYKVDGDPILDRDNVGLVLLLELAKEVSLTRCKICVANTHILFNKRRGDVKLAQLVYLLAKLDKVAQIPGKASGCYYPTVLCGDFNFVPNSALHRFILTGKFNYEGKDPADFSGQEDSQYFSKSLSQNILPSFLSHDCTLKSSDSGDVNNSEPGASGKGVKRSSSFPESRSKREKSMNSYDKNIESSRVCNEESRKQLLDKSYALQNNHVNKKVNEEPKYGHPMNEKTWGRLRHSFNFISAYKHFKIERHHPRYVPEVTTQHCERGTTVDYIFFTVKHKEICERNLSFYNIKSDKLYHMQRLGLLSAEEIAIAGNLPNEHVPSDHLPIIADFALM